MNPVTRSSYLTKISEQFRIHAACALLGPRQVGKTTLARMYSATMPIDQIVVFDLENPIDLARLSNPLLTLSKYQNKLIIIDEIQRLPELFPVLRVLIDDPNLHNKYLLLGSASRELLQQTSETLAGRIGYIEVMPFGLVEVGSNSALDRLFVRGGFPKAFLAEADSDSYLWLTAYIQTFLERDIPNLGFQVPALQMRRFWLMLAHYHGQILNVSELAKSMGVSQHLIRKYIDILAGTFMIRVLQPWHENLSKRQVKLPKIYFRDSGILNCLLGLKSWQDLDTYPKLGSFWEGFALEEILKQEDLSSGECFFWSTHSGAELDLLVFKNGKKIGYEFKYSENIKLTPSMRSALRDLKLDHLYVIYPGAIEFQLTEQVTVKNPHK